MRSTKSSNVVIWSKPKHKEQGMSLRPVQASTAPWWVTVSTVPVYALLNSVAIVGKRDIIHETGSTTVYAARRGSRERKPHNAFGSQSRWKCLRYCALRTTVAGIKDVAIRPSVRLSVPFCYCVPFTRRRYARVAVSRAFDRGQQSRPYPHPNAISGGISLRRAIGLLITRSCSLVWE